MGIWNSDWDLEEKHPACHCGCGELADECSAWITRLARPTDAE